jgi:putative Holliday junction resolvase
MKHIGIDYGTKKIGIAVSDEGGSIAFPRKIVIQSTKALTEIIQYIHDEGIQKIIIGNSLMQNGERNSIMDDIDAFAEQIGTLSGLPVEFCDERFSSSAVRAFDWKKPVATPRRTERDTSPVDDRAAAVMLQRYLDRI